MKRLFGVALGILTAIGGFVDIGDIVANTETGARFGMSLAWVVVVGVIGICLFAGMAGRVAAVSGRAVSDLVRERLGARVALVNLGASFFITFLTLAAEIGGVAFLEPRGIQPGHLSQVALPTLLVLGKLGLAVLLVGFFAATFGAALLVVLLSILLGAGLILTTIDPITVTGYSIVLSAAALPLTHFPILVVANDPDYMGDKVNSWFTNALGSLYLVLLLVVAAATIPLMILTKAGS